MNITSTLFCKFQKLTLGRQYLVGVVIPILLCTFIPSNVLLIIDGFPFKLIMEYNVDSAVFLAPLLLLGAAVFLVVTPLLKQTLQKTQKTQQ